MEVLTIQTSSRTDLVQITEHVQRVVAQAGMDSGLAHVYVPHTTAGVTVNENADPSVVHDMIEDLERIVPWQQPYYHHREGNSAAHVKATLVGSSVSVPVLGGRLALGTWQGIYLCEFDGPRTRRVVVTLVTGT